MLKQSQRPHFLPTHHHQFQTRFGHGSPRGSNVRRMHWRAIRSLSTPAVAPCPEPGPPELSGEVIRGVRLSRERRAPKPRRVRPSPHTHCLPGLNSVGAIYPQLEGIRLALDLEELGRVTEAVSSRDLPHSSTSTSHHPSSFAKGRRARWRRQRRPQSQCPPWMLEVSHTLCAAMVVQKTHHVLEQAAPALSDQPKNIPT